MNYQLNLEKLEGVLSDFYHATGVEMFLVTGRGVYSHNKRDSFAPCIRCETGLFEKCRQTQNAQINRCKSGITNVVLPVLCSDEDVELYLFFSFRHSALPLIKECVLTQGTEVSLLINYYEGLSPYDDKKLEGVMNLANVLCAQLIASDIIYVNKSDSLWYIKSYIDKNFDKPLSIDDIIQGSNVSKSSLYRVFKTGSGFTPREYVNKKRIEKAVPLLIDTEFNINEISDMLGFSSAAYFRSVFRREQGCSPTTFRKKHKKSVIK